jgi:hypothetical protein
MKVYGEVELLLHSFLNLDLGKSECLLYVPTALPPRKEPVMLVTWKKEVSNSEE